MRITIVGAGSVGTYLAKYLSGEHMDIFIIDKDVVLVAQGFPIVDAFFSSFSCVSNNGLGASITGITGSFDFLPSFGKWVMSLLMLAGRLEIITLIALLVPDFWRK